MVLCGRRVADKNTHVQVHHLVRANHVSMRARPCAAIAPTLQEPPRPGFVMPFVGDTIPFLRNWEEFCTRRVAELGPVFRTNILGQDVTMVCDAQLGKEMAEELDVAALDTETSDIMLKAFTWDGATAGSVRPAQFDTPKGLKSFKRTTYVESFGPTHMPAAYPTIEGIFRKHMDAAAATGKADITSILQDATLQIVYARIVGRPPVDSEADPMMHVLGKFCGGLPGLMLPNWLNVGYGEFQHVKEQLRDACMAQVQDVRPQFEAVKRGDEAPPSAERTSCFIWRLLDYAASSELELTTEDWVVNIVLAYMAGHETTRWAGSLLLLQLSENPSVVQELEQEMTAAQKEFGPQFWAVRAAAAKLPFCEAVITETMRLMQGDMRFGSSMINIRKRVARAAVPCSDYELPAGETIIIAIPPMIHTLGAFAAQDGKFDRQFNPHRFIKAGKVAKPAEFEPFGFGPRRCPGDAMATMELRALLKLVACDGLRVDFEKPDSAWGVSGITAAIKNGACSVRFASA